ncbi:hypothetical protein ACJX0J_006380, partial [Zea mays]
MSSVRDQKKYKKKRRSDCTHVHVQHISRAHATSLQFLHAHAARSLPRAHVLHLPVKSQLTRHDVKAENVENFIRTNLIYRFGVPSKMISDNGWLENQLAFLRCKGSQQRVGYTKDLSHRMNGFPMTENMSHIILGKKPLSYVAQSQIYAPRNSDAANPVIINRELKIGELDNSTRGWRSQPTISGICFYPYAPTKQPEQAFTLGNRMISHGLGWENYDIEYIPIPSGYAEWGTIILAKHSFNLRGDGEVDGEFYEEYVPSHHEREPSMLLYPKCLSQLLEYAKYSSKEIMTNMITLVKCF